MESSSNNLLGKFAITFTFHLFEFDNFRNNFLLNYLHFSQNSMFSVSRIRLRWEMMLCSSSAMMKCPLSTILYPLFVVLVASFLVLTIARLISKWLQMTPSFVIGGQIEYDDVFCVLPLNSPR